MVCNVAVRILEPLKNTPYSRAEVGAVWYGWKMLLTRFGRFLIAFRAVRAAAGVRLMCVCVCARHNFTLGM